ncbi:D-glycero-alpha-D-manno-heptose-1,7-bisphosphate 7-phosphatase [Edaphobacter flagellatus]|uniref:D-glycero-alpha-D-manno-heptose-1,7-bisphosphate 7-phosphatase n=1 Tax=Edaphobacter flagellatus TaxID=1933044 RepID=UPI0021B1BE63|nr:HAD family hydrolase [Edaphobacter flagellatus]
MKDGLTPINGPQRALFLDRDGVVNEEIGYLHKAEDVRFVPGIFSLCRTAMQLGYRLVVVTNQAGIARGYYTEADFEALMQWMREELRAEGVELDAVYYCPYHPEHGIGEYRREHEDRKPGTGMLRRAVKEFGISLVDSVMVGDRCSDIVAANRAELRQVFLVAGIESGCDGNYLKVNGLDEIEQWLLTQG